MNRFERILDAVVIGITTLAASTMIAATFLQVFFRYAIGRPLFWSEEMGRYCFVYIVFIGGAWAGRNRAHLGVDYLVAKLPPRFACLLEGFGDMAIIAFSLVLVAVSLPVTVINMRQSSPALGIPMGIVYLAIPIGFLLLALYYLVRFLGRRGEAPAASPDEGKGETSC